MFCTGIWHIIRDWKMVAVLSTCGFIAGPKTSTFNCDELICTLIVVFFFSLLLPENIECIFCWVHIWACQPIAGIPHGFVERIKEGGKERVEKRKCPQLHKRKAKGCEYSLIYSLSAACMPVQRKGAWRAGEMAWRVCKGSRLSINAPRKLPRLSVDPGLTDRLSLIYPEMPQREAYFSFYPTPLLFSISSHIINTWSWVVSVPYV